MIEPVAGPEAGEKGVVQILARHYADRPALAVILIGELAEAAGSERLIGGQMEDILNEGKTDEASTLGYIQENKTAALIVAALSMGLAFSGPDGGRTALIKGAGYHIGMAFQIIDDILDVTAAPETLGKPVGHDTAVEKCTSVALRGLEGARADAMKHTDQAIEAIHRLGGTNQTLLELIDWMSQRAR